MFVGHVGVGLALKKVDRNLNAGWLIAASLLCDLLLWALVLVGIESVIIPPDYAQEHLLSFSFPLSHSLLLTSLWSIIVFCIAYLFMKRSTRLSAAIALSSAVFLHWICDLIEHTSDLPLANASSAKFGFGLWEAMPIALGVEILLAALGLWIYFKTATETSSARKWGLFTLVLFTGALTVYGGLAAPPPPGVVPLAASSLATNILVIILAFVIDRKRTVTS